MTPPATVAPMPLPNPDRARMFKGRCEHGSWWALLDTTDDGDGGPPTGTCPDGCVIVLTTVEPRT